MTIYDTIVRGISTKTALTVVRKQDGRERYVCPHLLGYSNAGILNLFCYQYGGYSSQPLEINASPANWRCYCVEDLLSVSLTDDDWQTYAQVSLGSNKCVVKVLFSV